VWGVCAKTAKLAAGDTGWHRVNAAYADIIPDMEVKTAEEDD
jgi:hypothetical protein